MEKIKTLVLKIDPENPDEKIIAVAADALKSGQLVAFPTETVYGLGANLLDERAIARLNKVKARPADKPFTVMICDIAMITKFGCDLAPQAKALVDKYWPGPLTIILKTGDGRKTGFRMPANKTAIMLLKHAGFPVAVPSANISGRTPPVTPQEVLAQMDGLIDILLSAGPAKVGIESTVVDMSVTPPKVLREGAISTAEILEAIKINSNFMPNVKSVLFICTGNSCRSIMAEGLLKKRLEELGKPGITVRSAGTRAIDGFPPMVETINVMDSEGVDVSGMRSTSITDDIIKESDLIFVMSRAHKSEIIRQVPEAAGKTFLLREYGMVSGKPADPEIPDPIGMDAAGYRACLNVIKEEVERIAGIL
ncbi:MAG: L-threonylcarbamoyladenylate synthase [Candidatus Omnitrophica bacterium]|nr:L-threonylcarbamoyladenylate synthase [Candidatus Omnitrophota bacterium]